MTSADQLLDNLATGVYDDLFGHTFTFMEFLKVFHPAEYEERNKAIVKISRERIPNAIRKLNRWLLDHERAPQALRLKVAQKRSHLWQAYYAIPQARDYTWYGEEKEVE